MSRLPSLARRLGGTLGRHPLLLVALVVGAVLPAVVAGATGNLSIPHNDAWSYSRIARHFAETGHIELLGWNRAALVGQFAVLGPLARWIVVQQLFVVLLSGVFIVSVHLLLLPRLGPMRAGLAAVAVALWPGYALLSTSFMADVPALAASVLALVIARRALRTDSPALFALAMLVGLWGCTIRAQSLAAPVAVIVVALATARSRTRVRLAVPIVVGVLFVVAFAAFARWHGTLANGDAASLDLRSDPLGHLVTSTAQAWFLVAVVAGPVALVVARPWRWRWRGWVASALAAVAAVLTERHLGVQGFFPPNYLAPSGAYAAVLPPVKQVFDPAEWRLVVVFALVMGVVLAGVIAEHRGRLDPILGTFSALTLLGTLAEFLTTQETFDRYMIGLLPAALGIVLGAADRAPRTARKQPVDQDGREEPAAARPAPPARALRRPSRAAASAFVVAGVAGLVAVAVLSAALAANALAFDRARWTVAEQEVARGVAPDRVDAGLEWMGWHAPGPVIDRSHSTGYGLEGLFSTTPSCVILAAQPLVGTTWALQGVRTYRTFLVAGHSRLWVYDTGAAGCTTG